MHKPVQILAAQDADMDRVCVRDYKNFLLVDVVNRPLCHDRRWLTPALDVTAIEIRYYVKVL